MEYQQVIQDLSFRVFQRGINYSLSNLQDFLARLDNPQNKLVNIIHLAGTNGKGSTLSFLASALISAGYKVGTFTSPHLISYQERICVNLQPIKAEDFVAFYQKIKETQGFDSLTEFEILTVLSILYFQKIQPDFLIYETGLGGRLDATNIFHPIISIITRIGFDHMAILGNSLPEIASEKAGIIKHSVPLITIKQASEVLAVFKQKAAECNAPFFVVKPSISRMKNFILNGCYQKENLALARKTLALLKEWGFNLPVKQIEIGLRQAFIAGRYQRIMKDNQQFILDAAHNPLGVKVLIETLKRDFPEQKFNFLVGILKRKELKEMLGQLIPFADKIYYCDFEPKESFSLAEAQQLFPKFEFISYQLEMPLPADKLLIITGSIYFLGKMGLLFGHTNDNLDN